MFDETGRFYESINTFYKRYSEFAICIENYSGKCYFKFYEEILDFSDTDENKIKLNGLKTEIVNFYKDILEESVNYNPFLNKAKRDIIIARINSVDFNTDPISFLKEIRLVLLQQMKA